MSVRDATVASVNAIFAQLDLDVGPEEVRDTAYDMGITTHLDGFPAEGIGGLRLGVTPLEMSNAYATLANGGIRNTATAIREVEFPNGDTDVAQEDGERTRAFSDGVAYEVTDVLKGVITSGTGTAASIGCAGQAGKTGTTDDYTDAWFVGYTPRFSTAVWVGYAGREDVDGIQAPSEEPMRRHLARLHGWPRRAADCPDFPEPREPDGFSAWSGSHTVSASPSSTPSHSHRQALRSASGGSADGGQGSGGGTASIRPTCMRPAPGRAPRRARAAGSVPRRLRRRRRDRRRGPALRLSWRRAAGAVALGTLAAAAIPLCAPGVELVPGTNAGSERWLLGAYGHGFGIGGDAYLTALWIAFIAYLGVVVSAGASRSPRRALGDRRRHGGVRVGATASVAGRVQLHLLRSPGNPSRAEPL